jgi:DNA-binding response OmpR family regulator
LTPTHRVLLVEDDTDTLHLLRLVLQTLPVELAHVGTGAEAVAALEESQPDLVFLDLSLPDMRGWDVLDRLKDHPHADGLRVIVLTAHAEPVHRLIGTLQPILAYLTKPVQADQLRNHVRAALRLP